MQHEMPPDPEEYPEKIPEGLTVPEQFVFSRANLKNAKKEIGLQSEALSERIERISRRCTVKDGFELVPQILNVTRDPDELKRLAIGLGRVAEVVQQHDELKRKLVVLEIVERDPAWVAWACGSFEVDDETVEDFLDGELDA